MNNKIILSALLLPFWFLLVNAKTYTDSKLTNPNQENIFNTISEAVQIATPGDTVLVFEAIFRE